MLITLFRFAVIFISTSILACFQVFSQDAANPEKLFVVKWLSSFSTHDDLNIKNGFLKSVKNIIFGSDDFNLSKPVNLVATDTNHYCILDQGLNNLVYINRNEARFDMPDPSDNYFPSIVGCALLDDDKYLITDSRTCKIYVFNSSEMTIIPLSDTLLLQQPTGIAYNKLKNEIVVSETSLHRITFLNMKGEILRTIGARGKDSAQFNFPTYLTFDSNGNLYVVDALNFRVQIFDKDNNIKYIFGSQGDASGYIASAKGIAVDSYGHIYLADAMFHVVQIFDRDGNFLYTFGNQGRGNGQFWMPAGIYIDSKDRIYVADTYNSRIQIFQLLEDE